VSVEWLFSAIVVTALAIIVIVVVAGGFLVVQDEDYSFAEYLADLSGLWTILVSALLGTLGRALLPLVAKLSK
jgi:dethiobiotin synthetase